MNLLEFAVHGGTVTLAGQPLTERLTPRQLRFLFATGAFAAGKAAAKAVQSNMPIGNRETPGMYRVMSTAKSGVYAFPRRLSGAARAAAKQAMQQQLKAYKALKKTVFPAMTSGMVKLPKQPGDYRPVFGGRVHRQIARQTVRKIARSAAQ